MSIESEVTSNDPPALTTTSSAPISRSLSRNSTLLSAGVRRPMTPFSPVAQEALMDEQGEMTPKLERALRIVFVQFAGRGEREKRREKEVDEMDEAQLGRECDGLAMTRDDLQRFSAATNGAPFPVETLDEIEEAFDANDQGELTWKGFRQLYQLQTETDEDETWSDLKAHGFNESLELVSSRREDIDFDEGDPVPLDQLRGLGMGGTRIGDEP